MKQSVMQLNNVLVYGRGKNNKIDLEELDDMGAEIRRRGFFLTGPVVLHKKLEKEPVFEILLPMSEKIKIDPKEAIFIDKLEYSHCVYSRHLLEEENIENVSRHLENTLEKQGKNVTDVFYVIISIPNGRVIDIYIPMEGDLNESI